MWALNEVASVNPGVFRRDAPAVAQEEAVRTAAGKDGHCRKPQCAGFRLLRAMQRVRDAGVAGL
jgi:hypothetical protein